MLTLPWPPKELSPNQRLHFQQLAKAKAAYRAQCGWIAKANVPILPDGKLAISIMFHPPTKRLFDIDGLLSRMKSGLDGIADAWGIDDVRFRPITIDIGEPIKNGCVKITLTPLTPPK